MLRVIGIWISYVWFYYWELWEEVVEVSRKGKRLSSFKLGKYSKSSANGICIDEKTDTIWVLCTEKYLLKFDANGKILKETELNYHAQDHICMFDKKIFVTVGDDYQGKDNYVCRISPESGKIEALYQVNDSNALEGILVYKDNLYIVNDGLYHSDKQGCSYLTEYSMNEFK